MITGHSYGPCAHTKATQKLNSCAYATVAGGVAFMLGGMVLVGALIVAAMQASRLGAL